MFFMQERNKEPFYRWAEELIPYIDEGDAGAPRHKTVTVHFRKPLDSGGRRGDPQRYSQLPGI